MHAIFQSLPGLIDELPDDNARAAIVSAVWPNVIGGHLREQSAVSGFGDGSLEIAVSDQEWKREFEEHASEIVYKLNRALGSSRVRRFELKIDRKLVESARSKTPQVGKSNPAAPPPALLRSADVIADPELRANFIKAAAACIERRDAK
jgi:hypothetical protein